LAATRQVISTFGVHITSVSFGINTLFQLLACQIASKRDPRVAANSDPLTA
jgi:hypothetical protein